jgi:dipeptidyl aminopeptidase/acylaminoacyl peptidase
VTVQHGLYRCAVAVAGVSDLSGMIEYADAEGGPGPATRYWKKFMGVTSAFEGELAPITPVKLVDKADAPILLIHGRDDTVVPFRQSVEMDAALKRAGKVDDFVAIDDADHWYLHEDARLIMVTRSVAFVEKYNPPDPAPVSSASAAPQP